MTTGNPRHISWFTIERLILALLLCTTITVWWQVSRSLRHELEITFIDVGQGDCAIIRSPTGRTLLIDGGGVADKPQASNDIGRWVVVPALYRRGIDHIDAVIVSHQHDDHTGGLSEVIGQVPTDMILDCPAGEETRGHERLLEAAKDRNIKVRHARVGDTFDLGGGAWAQVLAPVLHLASTDDDCNNSSVVVRITYGRISFLFTGDIESDAQKALLTQMPNCANTVLKVPHHGSMDSADPAFLGAVHPAWAVISVGANNPFGHPHQVTLDMLRNQHIRTFRTDEMGDITMRTDGVNLSAEWSHRDHWEHVELKRR